jgi:hypothetical protein
VAGVVIGLVAADAGMLALPMPKRSTHLCNHLDFNADPQQDLRHAKGAAGMGAAGAEHLANEFAGALACQDDWRLLREKR